MNWRSSYARTHRSIVLGRQQRRHDADLREVYDTERHLLYVACTCAREHLHVSGVERMSECVDDLKTQ